VLDPIDGTRGFVGMRQYAVCLGLLDAGQARPRYARPAGVAQSSAWCSLAQRVLGVGFVSMVTRRSAMALAAASQPNQLRRPRIRRGSQIA
jgi:3'-phosphoadenosine 5'-phosphosulfate (PAPS) 3'-phosphatase